MSTEEKAHQMAVNQNIDEVTSGKHIRKNRDPGEGIIRTGGVQRMDIIDNQTIPNIQIREDWLQKHARRRGIEQDEAGYNVPGQMSIRQRLEAVTRVEDKGESGAITRIENQESTEGDTQLTKY